MKKLFLLLLSAGLLGACSSQSQPETSTGMTEQSATSQSSSVRSSEVATTETSTSFTQKTSGDTVVTSQPLTAENAIQRYQAAYPNTEIETLELDRETGEGIWTIEGFGGQEEYTLKLKEANGAVLQEYHETDDDNDEEKLNLENLLSIEAATQIAQDQVSGTVIKWSLETDDGVTYWEVSLQADGDDDHEVKIDSQTGAVLETDLDD